MIAGMSKTSGAASDWVMSTIARWRVVLVDALIATLIPGGARGHGESVTALRTD